MIFAYFLLSQKFSSSKIIHFYKMKTVKVFTVFSSGSFCQIYRVTGEALIAETMVWPILFLMNVTLLLRI